MVERSSFSRQDPEQTSGLCRTDFQSGRRYRSHHNQPVSKIKKFGERSNEETGEVSVLTTADTRKLFQAADPEVIPYLTLSYFAGIRRATLERLDWSDIKFAERRAIVPRYKAKNGKHYRVTLSDNAIEWLRPHVRESGPLLAISRRPIPEVNRVRTGPID
jgi:integrase